MSDALSDYDVGSKHPKFTITNKTPSMELKRLVFVFAESYSKSCSNMIFPNKDPNAHLHGQWQPLEPRLFQFINASRKLKRTLVECYRNMMSDDVHPDLWPRVEEAIKAAMLAANARADGQLIFSLADGDEDILDSDQDEDIRDSDQDDLAGSGTVPLPSPPMTRVSGRVGREVV